MNTHAEFMQKVVDLAKETDWGFWKPGDGAGCHELVKAGDGQIVRIMINVSYWQPPYDGDQISDKAEQ